MSRNDIKIVEPKDVSSRQFLVQDRTSSSSTQILAGEPVKQAADGSPYVIKLATGDPEIGTDLFIGIAVNDSTETASADGVVQVAVVVPGVTLLEAKATTPANIDTQAKINALIGDCVCYDLTSTTFTIDENEGNDNNVHGLIIQGGDPAAGTLTHVVKTQATMQGAAL